MTIEEAKEQLSELIYDRKSFIVSSSNDEIYHMDIEALEKAMEILEKQIPKKPICIDDDWGKCPICGNTVVDFGEKYCFNCGQALDWESDNDD